MEPAHSSQSCKADVLVQKLEEGQILAQAALVWRQQIMEDNANCGRQQAIKFKLGDYKSLNLENIETPRPSKILSWLHAKYNIVKIISCHVVELDTLIGIHPRFHVDLLKKASNNLLPSQLQNDYQPDPIDTNSLV